jgi:uncharacterized protein YcbK (DUF882 family)
MDRQLSKHFWLREFLRSETASRMGRKIESPPHEIVMGLESLCLEVLEPLRESMDTPFTIISGWRPEWLNKAVGGSKNSDHMRGRAADLIVAGASNAEVCNHLKDIDLPFKQCILEFPPGGWVHISVGEAGVTPPQQFLTAVKRDGNTFYLPGIKG